MHGNNLQKKARLISKIFEELLQLHYYQKDKFQQIQQTDDEFNFKLSLNIFTMYDEILNILKNKFNDNEKHAYFTMIYYIQGQDFKDIKECWRFQIDNENTKFQDCQSFIRIIAGLAIQMPIFIKRNQIKISHQILFDQQTKIKLPKDFIKLKFKSSNINLTLKYCQNLKQNNDYQNINQYHLSYPKQKDTSIIFSNELSKCEIEENYLSSQLIRQMHKNEDLQLTNKNSVDQDNSDQFDFIIEESNETGNLNQSQKQFLKKIKDMKKKTKLQKKINVNQTLDKINLIKQILN